MKKEEISFAGYAGSLNLKIALLKECGEIRYTTDGSMPTASSALYKDGITLTL